MFSYFLEINQEYVKRISRIGKRDLIYEICAHLDIIDRSKVQPPSQVEVVSKLPFIQQPSEKPKTENRCSDEYLELIYEKEV